MKSFIDVRFNNSLFFAYIHVYKSAMMMIEDNPNLFHITPMRAYACKHVYVRVKGKSK